MGAVVIAALELGETLADAHLGGLHYTYRSPAGSNGPAAVQAAPPLTSPSWLRPHLSVSGAADISRTSADANSSAGAPDLIPTEIVDGLRRASEVEIDYSGFLFALATLAEKAAPYLPELEAFLVANPEVVVALVVVATFFLVLGLAHRYGPSAFNALDRPERDRGGHQWQCRCRRHGPHPEVLLSHRPVRHGRLRQSRYSAPGQSRDRQPFRRFPLGRRRRLLRGASFCAQLPRPQQ